MPLKFKVGQKVRVVAQTDGWGPVREGDIGTVTSVREGSKAYYVNFEKYKNWYGKEHCFVPLANSEDLVKKAHEAVKKLCDSYVTEEELTQVEEMFTSLEEFLIEQERILKDSEEGDENDDF